MAPGKLSVSQSSVGSVAARHPISLSGRYWAAEFVGGKQTVANMHDACMVRYVDLVRWTSARGRRDQHGDPRYRPLQLVGQWSEATYSACTATRRFQGGA